jgi:hypothetical protein
VTDRILSKASLVGAKRVKGPGPARVSARSVRTAFDTAVNNVENLNIMIKLWLQSKIISIPYLGHQLEERKMEELREHVKYCKT